MRRDVLINIRLQSDEKQTYLKAAKREKMRLSEFCRFVMRDYLIKQNLWPPKAEDSTKED